MSLCYIGQEKGQRLDLVLEIQDLLRSMCAKENNFAVIDILVVYNVILIVIFCIYRQSGVRITARLQ